MELPARLAVLVSGGLDSAILLGHAAWSGRDVHPLYVRNGHFWEKPEERHLRAFLDVFDANVQPLHVLEVPVADVYQGHWSLSGLNVPDEKSDDAAVYLPGRNVLLLGKSMLWCHLRGIDALALGHLSSNPFPDATEKFFRTYQDVVNLATGGQVRIIRPFAEMSKADVMRLGASLPLELTFSCIDPRSGRHCGSCNKCGERRAAFASAGLVDKTNYDSEKPCTA